MDDSIRELKGDIEDRLKDIFGIADFTLDPIVPTQVALNRTGTAKILGGTAALSLRNAADSADNILITDAGVVTLRNTLNGVGAAFSGAVSAASVSGDGAGLTNLDASKLTGTVAAARISGYYPNITGVGTITAGVWNGTAITDTYLAGISGSKVTGTVANATTAANCTGNAATATNATHATNADSAANAGYATNAGQLGGAAPASYARTDIANNLTGNQVVSAGYVQANAFYVV
jgi:hypothetical protein